MNNFDSIMSLKLAELRAIEKKIVKEVWENKTEFIKWPKKPILLWDGNVRERYHTYPDDVKEKLKSKGIHTDSRSNGPAITSFLFAGGARPKRASNPPQEWNIHHIYDGKFPWPNKGETLHAVKDGKHFTQSAGLIAVHPIADALAEEYFYFAWLLRREAFLRFHYDPDIVFSNSIDEYGFTLNIEQKLRTLGYRIRKRNERIREDKIVHIVHSSEFNIRFEYVGEKSG